MLDTPVRRGAKVPIDRHLVVSLIRPARPKHIMRGVWECPTEDWAWLTTGTLKAE